MYCYLFLNKQRYSTIRVYHVLCKENISVSLKHVQKLMRHLKLCSITIRKCKRQKNKQAMMPRVIILNQDFTAKTICE
ncbi:IS3 family transposase [Enterococcus devriesei]|uniref:IS3 family transposase n=1 Tax=Enterococcus devriesei TaxID=319970 RepID=UPI0035E44579